MDPIADMIIAIKNAGIMKKESVVLPYSNLKMSILECLAKAGFVVSAKKVGKKTKKVGPQYIEVTLAYDLDTLGNKTPKVSDVKRVSKTSKRVYTASKDIRKVKSGYGALIVSTPKGVMTGDDARKVKVGGEALFQVW